MKSAIYVIEAIELNRVKIGIARRPKTRLETLQIGSPVRLSLAGCYRLDDAQQIEREVHRLLRNVHLWGEWFQTSAAYARCVIEHIIGDETEPLIEPPEPKQHRYNAASYPL